MDGTLGLGHNTAGLHYMLSILHYTGQGSLICLSPVKGKLGVQSAEQTGRSTLPPQLGLLQTPSLALPFMSGGEMLAEFTAQ